MKIIKIKLNSVLKITQIFIISLLIVKTGIINAQNKQISINKFNSKTNPELFDGCSCTFANTKSDFINNNYLYTDDASEFAWMKINGKIEKFILTKELRINNKTVIIYYNINYSLTITYLSKKITSDESSTIIGTIEVEERSIEDKKNKFIFDIWGTCGC